jgi:hypothetical protein
MNWSVLKMKNEEKVLDIVMKRFYERKKEIESNPNPSEKDVRGLKIVERFITSPMCFATAEPLMSIATLKFLGYSDKEINDYYFKLIFEQSTYSEYKYVDPEQFEENVDKSK